MPGSQKLSSQQPDPGLLTAIRLGRCLATFPKRAPRNGLVAVRVRYCVLSVSPIRSRVMTFTRGDVLRNRAFYRRVATTSRYSLSPSAVPFDARLCSRISSVISFVSASCASDGECWKARMASRCLHPTCRIATGCSHPRHNRRADFNKWFGSANWIKSSRRYESFRRDSSCARRRPR
jgi:hypothetical protein